MGEVLIDLGEPGHAPDRPARRRPVSYRVPLGLLALALVALVGGAGHLGPPIAPTVIPARLGDTVLVDGNLMFLAGSGPAVLGTDVENRTVAVYALPEAKLLSRTTVAVSGAISQVRVAGDILLVEYQIDTNSAWAVVALPVGADRALWRHSGRLSGASVADGLALVDDLDGKVALDLRTGRDRWRVPAPADVYIAEAGGTTEYPQWLVGVTAGGRLEVRDARTGRVLASAEVEKGGDGISPVGDLVLVDGPAPGIAAYRLPALTKVWQSATDLPPTWMRTDCGDLVCVFTGQRAMTALDTATGRARWQSDQWGYAEPAGDRLITTLGVEPDGRPQIWVADRRTGQSLGNFGHWHYLGEAAGGTLYGQYAVDDGYTVVYGHLDPATLRTRVLGHLDRVSGNCQTGGGALICRLVDASVVVTSLG